MNINANNFYIKRKEVYDKIQNSSTAGKILLSFIMACFTGLMAQIIIPLPWTPVPITAQTFAVLTSGLILGKRYGLLSQVLYIVLGIAFVPWFGGMTSGINIVLGSDIGYFIGFLIAAYFIGAITEKYANMRKFRSIVLVIGVANFALIYIPGLIGLAIWLYIAQGVVVGIPELIMMGLAPFIIGDIVKVIGAASISKIFLPKE